MSSYTAEPISNTKVVCLEAELEEERRVHERLKQEWYQERQVLLEELSKKSLREVVAQPFATGGIEADANVTTFQTVPVTSVGVRPASPPRLAGRKASFSTRDTYASSTSGDDRLVPCVREANVLKLGESKSLDGLMGTSRVAESDIGKRKPRIVEDRFSAPSTPATTGSDFKRNLEVIQDRFFVESAPTTSGSNFQRKVQFVDDKFLDPPAATVTSWSDYGVIDKGYSARNQNVGADGYFASSAPLTTGIPLRSYDECENMDRRLSFDRPIDRSTLEAEGRIRQGTSSSFSSMLWGKSTAWGNSSLSSSSASPSKGMFTRMMESLHIW